MSRYLAMLKGQKTEKRPHGELTELTKPGCVSFVSTPTSAFQEKTPGLLATIKRMAMFYGYTDENLAYALSDARANPDTWRELIRNDRNAALFIQEIPPHQIEVVNMLRADSSLRYAFTTRIEGDDVIVSLAVRDVAVCDLAMPANSYDPLTFWKTIQEVTQ